MAIILTRHYFALLYGLHFAIEGMLGSIKPSKTHHVFHEMPVPNQEGEWSCIYVSCIDAVSVSKSFLLDF